MLCHPLRGRDFNLPLVVAICPDLRKTPTAIPHCASPSVIFLDEPTTGLDVFQEDRVMETLRQLVQDGHTVICSIHQPRGSIYNKFDDFMLLSEGAVVYIGPAKDEPLDCQVPLEIIITTVGH